MLNANNGSIYEPDKRYICQVVDMLSPECNVFTCGINGNVKEYPTKRDIELTGRQITMLMECSIPQAVTNKVHGLDIINGYQEIPRFAITVKGFGAMPTANAYILNGKANVAAAAQQLQSEDTTVEDAVRNLEAQNSEPTAQTSGALEFSSIKALKEMADSLGIAYAGNVSKATLIARINAAQEANVVSQLEG